MIVGWRGVGAKKMNDSLLSGAVLTHAETFTHPTTRPTKLVLHSTTNSPCRGINATSPLPGATHAPLPALD